MGIADRPFLLQPVQLFDFVCSTEANRVPKLLARLLGLLDIALCHTSSLCDQISKDADIGYQYQDYYPDRLPPARNVAAPEQVTRNRNEQPEPNDEDEYREDVVKKFR